MILGFEILMEFSSYLARDIDDQRYQDNVGLSGTICQNPYYTSFKTLNPSQFFTIFTIWSIFWSIESILWGGNNGALRGHKLGGTDGRYWILCYRYAVYDDCDLIEIGEPFAEQPYALAVQQGSYLQEMLSRVILELQKDRFFETLQSKYWNSTKRKSGNY